MDVLPDVPVGMPPGGMPPGGMPPGVPRPVMPPGPVPPPVSTPNMGPRTPLAANLGGAASDQEKVSVGSVVPNCRFLKTFIYTAQY